MSLRDLLLPFTAWKNLAKEPITIKKPLEREGAPRYRGFHQNDIESCIGCGTCEEICQNAAIDLVPADGVETVEGDSGLRPRIDYGRCCWCALCVDVCTTGSLTMSNEFTWSDEDPEVFRFTPGIDRKSWDKDEQGYSKADEYELIPRERISMEEKTPTDRNDSFVEIVKGYSEEQAKKEADRCVECGLCTATCPAHMDIPEYIKTIRNGNLEEGLRLLYRTNPLPEICGRICTHKCETVCAMSHRGDAISIRWLKRYIADQIPRNQYKEILGHEDVNPLTGQSVAMVGAGPASLAAAYDLALLGYRVTIFEKLDKPGGMMRYGIPEYRLPYDQLDMDIDYISSLGVEIRCGVTVGKDIAMEQLREEHDAVFIGTGLHTGRSTRVPGVDHPDVYQAVDLLRDFTDGREIPVKERVVVIGGGNVAMDISRTLARLQRKKYGTVKVITTSLETEDVMPADREEIVESREEDITIEPGWGPREIMRENNTVTGVSVVRCLSVFDDDGRFSPTFDENQKRVFDADMVVESIGQSMDVSYLIESMREKIATGPRGRIPVNKDYRTALPWLFAGGDMISGPDVIHAVADGHRVAKGIDRYLHNKKKDNA